MMTDKLTFCQREGCLRLLSDEVPQQKYCPECATLINKQKSRDDRNNRRHAQVIMRNWHQRTVLTNDNS